MSCHCIYRQILEDIDSDPVIVDRGQFKSDSPTIHLRETPDIHFFQIYMFISDNLELRRLWLEDYLEMPWELEDVLVRKNRAIKSATMFLLASDCFHLRGKTSTLYAFGMDSEFAKEYEVCQLRRRKYRKWIWDELAGRLENHFDHYMVEMNLFELDE